MNSGTVFSYSNDVRPLSWTDGNPTATGSNNPDGLYIGGIGQGLSFTAPADTTVRTVVVHVGGYESGGTLTAHLSDGSAPDFSDITAAAAGQFDRNYALTYQAASAQQTLTVSWVMNSGTAIGNVTLRAAALQGGGGPTSIIAIAGTPQSATVNTAFATMLQVTVASGGTPANGATVTFTAPATGASGTFNTGTTATAMTNASGVATAPALTASSQAGVYSVTASVTGAATAASFSLTNNAGPAAAITASAGTSQSTKVSTAFATALQVAVKDSFSNPVNAATVTFTAPATGASGTFSTGTTATAMTNASGVATAPTLTANSQTGGYSVTASVTGAATAASFSLTNSAGSAASITASAGHPQSTRGRARHLRRCCKLRSKIALATQ